MPGLAGEAANGCASGRGFPGHQVQFTNVVFIAAFHHADAHSLFNPSLLLGF